MKFLPITKQQKELHEVSGIVYTAQADPDSEGDFISDPEVLKSAMIDFMLRWSEGETSLFNIDHNEGKPLDGVKIIESFFTEEEIMKNGVAIPPHSWVLTLKIPEHFWPEISQGTGYSMQGSGETMEV